MAPPGITTSRRASGRFRELIRISSRNEGDMQGWFQLTLDSRTDPDPPTCRGIALKRLMGFEPTTFCMATTPASGDFRAGTRRFAGDLWRAQSALRPSMGAVVCRYAAVRELLARSSRNSSGGFQLAGGCPVALHARPKGVDAVHEDPAENAAGIVEVLVTRNLDLTPRGSLCCEPSGSWTAARTPSR